MLRRAIQVALGFAGPESYCSNIVRAEGVPNSFVCNKSSSITTVGMLLDMAEQKLHMR